MYQLIKKTDPKARQKYKCIWCGEPIEIGEKHVHEVSKYDYVFQDHRWHIECFEAGQSYFQKEYECEFDAYENRRPAKLDSYVKTKGDIDG